MKKWVRMAAMADRYAIPFWIILIVYAVYEIANGNPRAWIVLVIGAGALVADSILAIENRKLK